MCESYHDEKIVIQIILYLNLVFVLYVCLIFTNEVLVHFLRAVEKILKISDAVINKRKEQDGFTGLHLAAFNGNLDVVDFLLKQVFILYMY